MRYSIPDPAGREPDFFRAGAAHTPEYEDAPGADPDAEPDDDDSGDDEPEPSWNTADNRVLQMPRWRMNRILGRMRGSPYGGRWRRYGSAGFSRRSLFGAMGRLARRARQVGAWRGRRGGSLP